MAEAPVSQLAVYTARPTVRISSQEYPKVSELIESMEMTESEGGMSALELRVTNLASDAQGGANFAFEDDKILKLGAPIAVYTGDETAPREIFEGKITALEADFRSDAPPGLVVLAEDIFQQARMTRRTKTYDNATISAVASDLASSLGLKPVITGLTDNIGTQVQLNESDLAFLRRLLARCDADLQVVGTELHVSPRVDVQRGTVTLELYSQLRRARVTADLAHQVNKLTITGWDAKQGARVSVTSTGANACPGSGRTGAQVLPDAFPQRSHHISHVAMTDQKEAQAMADAAFDQRARRFVCIEATAEGNAQIRVGTNVQITGLGARFDNTYYVVNTCHRYDLERGYETDFEAECAYLGRGQ